MAEIKVGNATTTTTTTITTAIQRAAYFRPFVAGAVGAHYAVAARKCSHFDGVSYIRPAIWERARETKSKKTKR